MFYFDSSKTFPTETRSEVLIRFQDCDPLRHLNNAKYFDYYFNAREDQVPKVYHIENADIYKQYGSIWVVYNHQIAYVKSAMLGEWVSIFTRLIWSDRNTAVVEYYMTDQRKTHLKNVLWTTFKYVDAKNGKKIDHQPKIMEYLKATEHPGVNYDPKLFEERIKEIKQEIEQP